MTLQENNSFRVNSINFESTAAAKLKLNGFTRYRKQNEKCSVSLTGESLLHHQQPCSLSRNSNPNSQKISTHQGDILQIMVVKLRPGVPSDTTYWLLFLLWPPFSVCKAEPHPAAHLILIEQRYCRWLWHLDIDNIILRLETRINTKACWIKDYIIYNGN